MNVHPGSWPAGKVPSITCPKCGRTSYHIDDIRHRYCGNCHEYHDALVEWIDREPRVPLMPGPVIVALETPPRLKPMPLLVDVAWAFIPVLLFIGGRVGASWWLLALLVPACVLMVMGRITLARTNARIAAAYVLPKPLAFRKDLQ